MFETSRPPGTTTTREEWEQQFASLFTDWTTRKAEEEESRDGSGSKTTFPLMVPPPLLQHDGSSCGNSIIDEQPNGHGTEDYDDGDDVVVTTTATLMAADVVSGTGKKPNPPRGTTTTTTTCPDARRLLVANLSSHITAPELLAVFGQFGNVENIKIVYNARTGKCRGFAFVTFTVLSDAQKSAAALDGKVLGDRVLTVRPATIKVREVCGVDGGGDAVGSSKHSNHLTSVEGTSATAPHIAPVLPSMMPRVVVGQSNARTPPQAPPCPPLHQHISTPNNGVTAHQPTGSNALSISSPPYPVVTVGRACVDGRNLRSYPSSGGVVPTGQSFDHVAPAVTSYRVSPAPLTTAPSITHAANPPLGGFPQCCPREMTYVAQHPCCGNYEPLQHGNASPQLQLMERVPCATQIRWAPSVVDQALLVCEPQAQRQSSVALLHHQPPSSPPPAAIYYAMQQQAFPPPPGHLHQVVYCAASATFPV